MGFDESIRTAEETARTRQRLPLGENSPLFLSYPKSGRTWIRYILNVAGIEIEFDHAGTGSRGYQMGRPFLAADTALCTHRRPIFMYRNPIDTAVSFYFQVHRRELVPGTWRRYRRLVRFALTGRVPPRDINAFMASPGYGVEKVCRYNRAWLDYVKTRRDALILTYEEMKADGESTIARLLAFLGCDPSLAEDLVQAASFERMRAYEATGEGGNILSVRIKGDPDSAKIRRGKVRGYVDYLDPDTIGACREVATRYGFDA